MVLSPAITATAGTYDIKFSASGSLISATRLQIDSNWEIRRATISPTGKLYAIWASGRMGPLNNAVMAFSPSGSLLWNDTTSRYFGQRGIIYHQHSIYIAGGGSVGNRSYLGSLSIGNSSFVGGYSVMGKLDTNGNAVWLKSWDGNYGTCYFSGLTALPNNQIGLAGVFVGILKRGKDSLVTPSNEGQNPFLLITDTAGATLTLDQRRGPGFYDWATAISSDPAGSIYIGGQYETSITAVGLGSGISTLGNTGFFIAKYG